jgi:hypothetical protein
MRIIGPARRFPLALAFAALAAFLATPTYAGTCSGGPVAGNSCSYNSECQVCTSGPFYGQPCSSELDCGSTCAKGGRYCSVHADCERTCKGGFAVGQACLSNSDCPGSFCELNLCTPHLCFPFSCEGGIGFSAGEADERLAVCLDAIFAPAGPASEEE